MKKFFTRLLWLIIFIVIVGLANRFLTPKDLPRVNSNATTTPEVVVQKDPIKEQLEKMSVDEKIGSLLILGFRATTTNQHITDLIEKYHVGGVNLLGWNIVNSEQTKKLTADLQDLYKKDHDLPFIIAVDQEGGTVVRFKFLNEKTAEPNVRTQAQAEQIAQTRATELKKLGVNMNFAPVVDFITDTKSYLYNRTFATTTEGTIALGKIMADTYLENGIMPVFKHFPGYGNSTINPHTSTTKFDGTQEMFNQNVEVFRSLLQSEETIPVMTAHIQVPWISNLPATKEKKFMTNMLRDDFKYGGVVITDDLDMASVGANQGQTGVDSILAGADMLISTPNDANHIVLIQALKKAVQDGVISEERLDESVYRVLKLRNKIEEIQ